MNSNYRGREIFFLKETDLQYLSAEDFKPDLSLVKLFKSKSPWENDNAIAPCKS
ncbi:MAG: hypothetical protein HC939_20690 [Pleurocapsa sp. SU_5_0]|nr:hypothetical protein [Pleurocapsa sp. SU_5_0]